jgi:hypothetical protein
MPATHRFTGGLMPLTGSLGFVRVTVIPPHRQWCSGVRPDCRHCLALHNHGLRSSHRLGLIVGVVVWPSQCRHCLPMPACLALYSCCKGRQGRRTRNQRRTTPGLDYRSAGGSTCSQFGRGRDSTAGHLAEPLRVQVQVRTVRQVLSIRLFQRTTTCR